MHRGWPTMLAVLCPVVLVCAEEGQRLSAPDAAAQARAERLVREVFHKEYAQTGVEQRRELAQRLLQQAGQTRDDAAGRYVLLREARDIAAGAGDAATGHQAIREMCRHYAADAAPMTLTMLQAAHRAAHAPEALAAVAGVAIRAAEDAVRADDCDRAGQLLSLGANAAQQARDLPLINRITARSREVAAIAAESAALKGARESLAANPENAQAHLLVGRFTCMVKNDWEGGLVHLARGSDLTLSALAQLELTKPADAARRAELADGWWDAASRLGELAKKNVQAHAGLWYRQALPGLSGLSLSVARKRLEEIESADLQRMNLRPGLRAELFKGIGFADRAGQRIDAQVDFEWGEEAPDPSLPKDGFSIRWTGHLRPPAPGGYELVIVANTGVRVWVDEKLVADEANLTRSRNGKRFPVELKNALHPIRIDYWDTTGLAKMQLHWLRPGAEKPEPVPASALVHEGEPR